uniref:Uncharacterized protein n=1 Tax=Melopsittacus undulatus TaxID=13146 RepID=A0A8V5GVU7_MELUD
MESAEVRPGVAVTLRALNEALGRPGALWVKESSARNLRHRDFLAPLAALRAAFPGGQVPADVLELVTSLCGAGVLPVSSAQQTPAGLEVRLQRPEAFRRLLLCSGPGPPPAPAPAVVLHCPALRGPGAPRPRHLRPLLLADHLAQLLRAQGVHVRLVPALSEEGPQEVLRQLRIDWPAGPADPDLSDAVSALKRGLARAPCVAGGGQGPGAAALPADVICKVQLKGFVEQQGLVGYDPNLDVLLVTEGKLRSVAELQQAALQCPRCALLQAGGHGSCCSILHVVSCEEEFQQQQLDLLWRILDPGPHTALQVRSLPLSSPLTAASPCSAGLSFRASVLMPSAFSTDEAWTEVIDTLTAAAIRFEMLSTAHRSQITLDLQDSSISTKGTKSGAFVMYNCARLATLFDTFQRAVEQGTYPPLPPPSELNFSCLREEGEWLLLFNYLLPFPEVLQQAAQLPAPTKGIRITANTEAVCKFLIQLSMDFSSYYNRVHVLGEPFPHLFEQMFARLQLLAAVRDVFHSALGTLHLPPLSQI